jgi:hypothetical protein
MADAVDVHDNLLKGFADHSRSLIADLDTPSRSPAARSSCARRRCRQGQPRLEQPRDQQGPQGRGCAARHKAVERLKQIRYFQRHAAWLIERFPDAELRDVPGLCKQVSRADIEAADWSLTPGRYVGVAPAEVDEDFDFEQVMRDIHTELADLNREAVELAARFRRTLRTGGMTWVPQRLDQLRTVSAVAPPQTTRCRTQHDGRTRSSRLERQTRGAIHHRLHKTYSDAGLAQSKLWPAGTLSLLLPTSLTRRFWHERMLSR